MAELQLVVIEGPNEGREFELSGATTIGRDTSAGLVIDDPEASRRHASVSVEGDNVTIEDLGSTNGTFVNGQRLSAAHTLGEGDKLRIGTTVFALRVEAEEVQATRVGTALPDLDDLQVTAPRQVPDFAKEEPPAAAEPEPPAPEPEPPTPEPEPPTPEPVAPEPIQPTAANIPVPPAPTQAPPPSSGPPGGLGGPPGGGPAAGPPPPPSAPPPPQPSAPPPPAPPAYAPPPPVPVAYAGGQGGYPINVVGDYPEAGIANWRPLLHWLMAIPHFVALFFIFVAGYFAFIGAWFSILFTGRYPPGIFNFLAGAMRWVNRVNGYYYLMTEEYPPFSLDEAPYPIRTTAQYPENGIANWRPLLQWLLAIPHFVVLYFLALAAYIGLVIAWFSILFTRRYPPGVFNFVLGVMRWQTRVYGYALLMTEEYPPFSLE